MWIHKTKPARHATAEVHATASLVTGSSGLLGTCLLERLVGRGEEVRTLDLVPQPARSALTELTYFAGDVCDPALVAEAAEGVDVIYHLAAAQRMKPQFKSWTEQDIFDRNLGGVRSVIETAERQGIRKVVHISSSGVYGVPRQVPCSEDHPNEPLGDYGHSKIAAEKLCAEAADRGLDITWLRPMSLFGPEMSGLFVMIYEWVRTGSPVFLLGAGRNRVQSVSAWDVADACLLAAEKPEARGRCFNLGSAPEAVPTVEEMMQGLIDHADTGSRVIKIPAALLRNTARVLNLVNLSPIVPEHYILADSNFILDISAAREVLGWEPRYDNIQMICDAYDWYAAAGESVRPPPHPMLRILSLLFPGRAAG
jgi:nucleoside-diphosphate-sugar epimerase